MAIWGPLRKAAHGPGSIEKTGRRRTPPLAQDDTKLNRLSGEGEGEGKSKVHIQSAGPVSGLINLG